MGENTLISWADHTFNPWIGCTKVSAGCEHCYAERDFAQRFGKVAWGKGQPRLRTSPATWKQPLLWNKWGNIGDRKRRVFCASLGDVFDDEVPREWRWELWHLIEQCDKLDWLILTKRPQNLERMYPHHLDHLIWVGVTVEDQLAADTRIRLMLDVDAKYHFLSCEPLLEDIDLRLYKWQSKINWIIAGGESGTNARPTELRWVRSLLDQSMAWAIPFHFKSWGEWGFQDDGTRCKIGKKYSGREIDGITWDSFPEEIRLKAASKIMPVNGLRK